MLKISTKLIFSLVIGTILILTVGAVNTTENQTNTSVNNSNESITPIPTTVSTVNPVGTVIPNVTVIPKGTVIPNVTVIPKGTVIPNSTGLSNDTTTTVVINTTQNQVVTQNTNVTISAPITNVEKNTAINIAINFTINNIGIDNPKVLDVTRKEKDLRVRVKDNSGENIVLLISPKGDATEEVQNTPIFVETKSETQNSFVGRHVSFQFTNKSILNFTLEGKLIFTSINLGFNSTKVRNIGSTLRISDASNTVIVHDNPNGIITESSMNEVNAIYTVTPEINSEEISKRVDLSSSDIKGSIISSDTAMAAFALVTGDNISVTLNHDKTTFTARVLGVGSANEDDFEDRIVQGIHDNRIGTILNIDTENSHDVIGFGVDTTVNRVSRNTVSLNVNSDTPEGRTVVLRAGKDIFTNLNLRILVDGHEIPQAVDYNDLFKNDKLSYLLVIGQNVEVLVSIPQFSEHEILVTSEPSEAVVTNTTTPVPTVENTVVVDTVTPIVTETAVPVPTKAPGFTVSTVLVATIVLFLLFRKNRQ